MGIIRRIIMKCEDWIILGIIILIGTFILYLFKMKMA